MNLSFYELVSAISGEILLDNEIKEFNKLCIDTRKIESGNIYLAIKGLNFNGNDYVEDAFKKGATIAIVSEIKQPLDTLKYRGVVILVKDTRLALAELAKYYRNKLGLKVVGITGSVGKTSTKDVVAAFLSGKYRVFKTKGNFNNDIGLPLMILELTEYDEVAVLEMGMSNLKEIEYLANIARPDIGIITNIGLSHIENLKTQDNILKAKMEITNYFNEENILIINAEDEKLKNIETNSFKLSKVGYNHEYEVNASNIILKERETSFIVNTLDESQEFTIKMPGKHNVLNALLAVRASLELGLSFSEMKKGVDNFEATSMRLQISDVNGLKIINDCYNASPSSMIAAIDVLANYKDKRKVAILGTMLELGDKAYDSHKYIGEYASKKIDLLIAVGEFTKAYKDGYNGKQIKCYESKEEALNCLKSWIHEGDVILVKASRGAKFEEIVKLLEMEK